MIFGKATYPVQRLPVVIPIGVQTEKGVEEIAFDVSAWSKRWPDMEVTVWHRLPGQADAYLTKSRREGDIVYWEVTDTDTQTPGTGRVELMGTTATGRKLSGSTDTRIKDTIAATTQDPPLAPPTWVDTVEQMIGDGGGVVLTIDEDGNATRVNDHPLADMVAREAAATAQNAAEGAASTAYNAQIKANEAAETANNAVTSVNGQQGEVVLNASDVHALPEDTVIPAPYTLPTASATVKGGVKVGSGLKMDGEVLEVEPDPSMELLETITIDEETAGTMEIIRTYSGLEQLRIIFDAPAQESAQDVYTTYTMGNVALTSGGRAYYGNNILSETTYKLQQVNGYWDCETEIGGGDRQRPNMVKSRH